LPSCTRLCERQPEPAQERQPLLVVRRRGRDRHVETADARDRVVVDLRKDDLLADPERKVPAAVERAGVEPAEVADARERDRHQAVEELPHPGAAQRDARAYGHPLAKLEASDRLTGEAYLGTLAGDRGQLLDRAVELLRLGLGLAHAHVERDLLHPRDLPDAAQAEVVLQARLVLLLVAVLESRALAV